MSAGLYMYRNNFEAKKTTSRMRKTTKIQLFNLIIKGYRYEHKFDIDYFICLAQYFMKKGYPGILQFSFELGEIEKFFMQVLFKKSYSTFQYHLINNKFNLLEFRRQFALFNEIHLKGLCYYQNRYSMPLDEFVSTEIIHKRLLLVCKPEKDRRDFYPNAKAPIEFAETLNVQEGTFKSRKWIVSKSMRVLPNQFEYVISVTFEDGWEKYFKKESPSVWHISIWSEKNENYIDFCWRIYKNYNAILSLDSSVLTELPEGFYYYKFKGKNQNEN